MFGNIEQAKGGNLNEAVDRKFTQNAGEAVYRFADKNLYVGGRYCTVKGKYFGFAKEATVNRTQVGGGWFLTQTLLAKLEWVKQEYKDFPTTDIRHNAQFDGVMFEAVVSF